MFWGSGKGRNPRWTDNTVIRHRNMESPDELQALLPHPNQQYLSCFPRRRTINTSEKKKTITTSKKQMFSTHIRRFTPETCSFVSLRLVYFSPYFLIFRFGEMELPLENLLQQRKEPQRFTILHEGTSNLEEDEYSRKQPKEPKAVKQPTVVRSPILKVCVLLSLSIVSVLK